MNVARRAFTVLLALLLIFLLFVLGARIGAGWYVTSGRFRRHVAAAVGKMLDARGSFRSLRYQDGTFFSDGYSAQGRRGAFFAQLRAGQISADVNWRGLLDHRWEIEQLKIAKLEVDFHRPVRPGAPHATGKAKPPSPWRLDLRHAEIADSTWRWGATPDVTGSISGTAITLQPNNGAWLLLGRGGTFRQSGWPSLTIESAGLRYTGPALFISDTILHNDDGRIDLSGVARFNNALDLQAHLERISVTPLLAPEWQLRLHGHVAGSLQIHVPLTAGEPTIQGDLQLSDGELEAVPLLDQLVQFTHLERFRRMTLTRGSVVFTRSGDRTTVQQLTLESPGLLRLEGSCTLIGGNIDAHFQLGVAGEVLKPFPVLQKRVFTGARDGFYWTPLRVTGPVTHPHEDLSARLETAAAEELLKHSRDLLKKKAKSLLEQLPR